MRLLFINYEYPPIGAGAATATAAMAHAASKLGHEVIVLTCGFDGRYGSVREGTVTLQLVRARRKRRDRSSIAEMASFVFRAGFLLPRLVRRTRPDACVVFFSMPCGPLGLLFRTLTGRPYIVSLRGGDVPGAEPGLARMHRYLRPLRRLVLSRSIAVVANSPGLAKMSQAADPIPVVSIPNGVDLDAFRPAGAPPAEPFNFLFVGRFNEQKNVQSLLDAAALLRDDGRAFRLSIVGDGPLRDELVHRADTLQLGDQLQWRQWLAREEMPTLYQSAHCLVNPSHYEGMPNVVLEAMACGIPAVVSDVAGNRDVVAHERSGLVVPPNDPRALAHAMARLMADRTLAMTLGAAARAHVEARYSWEATTRAYLELLPG